MTTAHVINGAIISKDRKAKSVQCSPNYQAAILIKKTKQKTTQQKQPKIQSECQQVTHEAAFQVERPLLKRFDALG